jgi:NAD(P)-dependent dehydrogenase (short-subunit alcohol dehydrogenase family)
MSDIERARFDGRVAVITGAGGGLGREHALLLASRGASLVVNDVGGFDPVAGRPLGDAAAVVDEIVTLGGTAVASVDSITTSQGAEAIVRTAIDSYGRVDIVVNNAGILRSCDFQAMTEQIWDEVLGVNLRGSYLVTRAAWTHMADQGYGRIVFMTSNSGLLGVPGSSAYAASKAGLWGLMRVLALEGASAGIHANAVAPIAFTRMSSQSRTVPASWREGGGDEWSARLAPSYVAPVVAWLAHENCELNGEVLSAAGGRVARFFMGLSPGVVDDELSIETVRDRIGDIRLEDGYDVLNRAFDEGRRLRRRLLG